MSVETMFDLSKFGKFEIDLAVELLQAYRDKVPDKFYDEGVQLCCNSFSGCVFLTNEDYQTLMMNGDNIEMFYSTSYNGYEGFANDLKYEFEADPDSWENEDVEYLHDNGILDDREWEAYQSSEESEIKLECEKFGEEGYFTFFVDRKWLSDYLRTNYRDKELETIYAFLQNYNSEQSGQIYEDALLDEESELCTDYKPSGE